MSVLKKYFDKSVNQSSPVQEDVLRVVQHDEDGNEYIEWKKVDYPTFQKSNGTVSVWSLEALLKAGINPDFPIHTGNPTRLEGLGVISQVEALADEILAENNNVKNDE